MNRVLLVDADYFIYQALHETAITEIFDYDKNVMIEYLEVNLFSLEENIRVADPNLHPCYFFSKGSFRKEAYKIREYKGNRKKKDEYSIQLMHYAIDWMLEKKASVLMGGWEADDLISIIHSHFDNTVILSNDKDLKQIAGNFLNLKTLSIDTITEQEAILNLYTQMLVGDSTDNIEGVKGCGKKGAEKILAGLTTKEEMETAVRKKFDEVYKEQGTYNYDQTMLAVKLLTWYELNDDQMYWVEHDVCSIIYSIISTFNDRIDTPMPF